MKKLHILVIKSFIPPFIVTFFISMFVLLMQFLWKYIDELVGKGLDNTVIAELLFYAALGLVPMAIPLGMLISSIMTFGSLGENNELTALKSSGVSLLRIMYPLLMVSVFITLFAFFFSNNVLPHTNLKTAALLYDIKHQRPELNLKEGIFNNDLENYTLRAGHKNLETNMMYNFMIYDHTNRKGNSTVTIADSAFMYVTTDQKHLVLHMYQGHSYDEIKDRQNRYKNKFSHQESTFEEQRLIFDMSGFELNRTDDALFKNHFEMMNLSELSATIDSLNKTFAFREENFLNNLLRNNYFRLERKKNLNDTLVNKKLELVDELAPKYMDVDSIFGAMKQVKKENIYNVATNYVSSTKSYISSTTDDFVSRKRWINRHLISWHKKFTLSLACLIFFFIGAPLGAIIRKGGLGMPVVVSVLLFIAYYIITLTGEKMVRDSLAGPFEGMWTSSIVLMALGFFLTYKAVRDSSLMNIAYYTGMIKSVMKMFGKKD